MNICIHTQEMLTYSIVAMSGQDMPSWYTSVLSAYQKVNDFARAHLSFLMFHVSKSKL